MTVRDTRSINTQNEKRASWRQLCRRRLSDHIADTLGIRIKPTEVRLRKEEDMPYAWHIDNDELKPLFEKQLSKHSVGAYMKLYVEVGHSFWAVRSQHGESSTEPSLKDQIEILRNENATLLQKLKLSEEYSAEVSQRKTELEFEVSNLQDAINASNSIISNYQQEIQQWTSTVKYYEAYCHQCTDELNQVISSLQRLKECFAPIMCGEVIES